MNILWLDDKFASSKNETEIDDRNEIEIYLQSSFPNIKLITVSNAADFINFLDSSIIVAILDIEGYENSESNELNSTGYYKVRDYLNSYKIPVIVYSGNIDNNKKYLDMVNYCKSADWAMVSKSGSDDPALDLFKCLENRINSTKYIGFEYLFDILSDEYIKAKGNDIIHKKIIEDVVIAYKTGDYKINCHSSLLAELRNIYDGILIGIMKRLSGCCDLFNMNDKQTHTIENFICLGYYRKNGQMPLIPNKYCPKEVKKAMPVFREIANSCGSHQNGNSIVNDYFNLIEEDDILLVRLAYTAFFIIAKWYKTFVDKHLDNDILKLWEDYSHMS